MRPLIAILILLTGCSHATDSQSTPRDQRGRGARDNTEAVPVSTGIVVEKAMPLDVSAVGSGEAVSSVQIHSQVTGQVASIHFAEGQDVTQGQVLFELDPRPFQLALAQAEAVLARDTAQNANAQTEVARYKALLDQGLIPREQYDSYVANAAASQATTGADQAAVDTARLNLQFTRITAPIFVIYIVLGILYESFIHLLTILSGLPSAGFGALLTLMLFKSDLNIYAFVGVIMLVGLVKKNGIMMVDVAVEQRRREGTSVVEAIFNACLVRFRPIMMTTMAALVGTLPIAFGWGTGAEARRPLGLAVVGGLLVSQTLTLYVTPVFYTYMEALSERLRSGALVPHLHFLHRHPLEP